MTYRDILRILGAAGICDAAYEASLLLSRFCGIEPSRIPLVRDEVFSSEELRRAVMRRAGRYPLQYILGEWRFCRENYILNEDCLIPRSDTELLVETAAACLPRGGRFIDAGAGSGCVSVSLLAAREDAAGTAFDISEGALAAVRANAETAGVAERLRIFRGDMTDAALWAEAGDFDAVISNPPYIPSAEIDILEPELRYEPRRALDGGEDGLDFYRAILTYAPAALGRGGAILLELGAGQAADVSAIAATKGFYSRVVRDMEGRGRVLVLRRDKKIGIC